MQDITWVGVVGVLLLLSTLLNLYNSSKQARKNADEPLKEVKQKVEDNKEKIDKLEYRLERAEDDINNAHTKIRENKEHSNKALKAQSNALLAILLWIKDPQHDDSRQIDEAIKEIRSL